MINLTLNVSSQTITLSLDLPTVNRNSHLADERAHFPERGKAPSSIPTSFQSIAPAIKTGSLYSYRTTDGYGFIEASDGEIFFMHRSKVEDAALGEYLDWLVKSEADTPVQREVVFEAADREKPESKYRAAVNVRPRSID